MKKIASVIAFVFCFFSVSVSAQTTRPTPPTDDGDVVKISTNLIQFDVTVTNKKGEQVTDLTIDDFEIFENGQKQDVTNLSYISVLTQTKTQSKKNQPKNGEAVVSPPIVKKLKPGEVRRTIALLVDDLSTSFGGINAVKDSLRNFVDKQMQPNDLVAVITASGGSGLFQQFTSDKRILHAAINRIKPNVAKIYSFTPVTNILQQSESPRYVAQRDAHYATGLIGSLNFLVKNMDRLPGRKALVLFSEGLALFTPQRPSTTGALLSNENERLNDEAQRRSNDINLNTLFTEVNDATRVLVESANRAGIVINTIDSRGLPLVMAEAGDGTTELRSANDLRNGSVTARQMEQANQKRNDRLFDTQSGLIFLAEETGGRAFLNDNGFKEAIEEAVNDQNGYYLLGYEPADESFDPKKIKFNKIEIKLKNRPDLKIKYRSGFVGISDKKEAPNNQTPGQELAETLFSPFDADEIGVGLTSVYFSDAKSVDLVSALLTIDGKNLVFTEESNGAMKGEFDVLAYTVDSKGKYVDKVAKKYIISVTRDDYRKVMEKGLVYRMNVPVKKPGGYQLKVALRDTKNGKIGSASQYIEVPNRKSNDLVLSGILLQNHTPEAVKIKSGGIQESRLQADTTVRQFRAGTYLSYVYEIYQSKSAPQQQLQSQVRLFRADQLLMEGKKELLQTGGAAEKIQAQGMISLGKDLAPGSYVLQILVVDPTEKGKDRVSMQYIDFEIVG